MLDIERCQTRPLHDEPSVFAQIHKKIMELGRNSEAVNVPERKKTPQDAALLLKWQSQPHLAKLETQAVHDGMPTEVFILANSSPHQLQQANRCLRRRLSVENIDVIEKKTARTREQGP